MNLNSFHNGEMLSILSFIFSVSQIAIHTTTLSVEIADTPYAQTKGLMHREELPEGSGMLFVYDSAKELSFWMKNTKIPLSVGFFDEEKKLFQIENMDPPSSASLPLRIYKSHQPSRYALEVPQGWFEKNKIKIGTKFTFLDPEN